MLILGAPPVVGCDWTLALVKDDAGEVVEWVCAGAELEGLVLAVVIALGLLVFTVAAHAVAAWGRR